MIGRRLGRFVIESPLGSGGMATVWRARDHLLGRVVALKVLDPELATSPKILGRFLREARSAAHLDHPGIVVVFDSGEAEGLAYIALSLIEGRTLSEYASHRLLPVDECLRIVSDAADALAHAHDRGLIHRDVTGRNIMVAHDRRVFVLDFGLSRAKWEAGLTTSDAPMGTASYMAPEVVRGGVADERTDVYGLGVVLYEALTGTFPFPGDNPTTVLFKTVNMEPVAPRERRPEIPAALEVAVFRAIARDPDARFQSAREMKEELDRIARMLRADEPMEPATVARSAERDAMEPRVPETSVTLPHPLYLAVLPFEIGSGTDDPEGVSRGLADRIPRTVRSALASAGVRVVHSDAAGPFVGDLREFGRRAGANAVLQGTVSRAGARLRVCYTITDSWRGIDLHGEVLDGSTYQPFELEDALVKSLSEHLRVAAGITAPVRQRDLAAREHYLQALGYLKRHDDEAAIDAAIGRLEGLLATEGDDPLYHAALVRAFLHKHQITHERAWESRATSACERALALGEDVPEVRLALGLVRLSAGQYSEALDEFRKVPGVTEADLGSARAWAELGRYAEAEAAATQLVGRHGDDWRCHSMLGWVCYKAGRYARSLESWRSVVDLAPNNARAHRNLGSVLYRLDRFEEAAEAYRKSLEVQPSDEAYGNLGTTLYYLGRHEESIAALRKAADLAPMDPVRWGNLGNAYRWMPGFEAESRAALDRAIALMRDRLDRNPAVGSWWAWLAGWLSNRGDAREALAAIQTALGHAPGDLDCMKEAVRVYYELGDREQSLMWLRRAREAGARAREFMNSRELAPMHDDPEFMRLLEEPWRDSAAPRAVDAIDAEGSTRARERRARGKRHVRGGRS